MAPRSPPKRMGNVQACCLAVRRRYGCPDVCDSRARFGPRKQSLRLPGPDWKIASVSTVSSPSVPMKQYFWPAQATRSSREFHFASISLPTSVLGHAFARGAHRGPFANTDARAAGTVDLSKHQQNLHAQASIDSRNWRSFLWRTRSHKTTVSIDYHACCAWKGTFSGVTALEFPYINEHASSGF